MDDTAAGRPWQLDDATWLARRYALVGDRKIAEELGCARATVVRARKRLGIDSRGVGTRRGTTRAVQHRYETVTISGSVIDLNHRFTEDQIHEVPATDDHIGACFRGWLRAREAHDHEATQDALLSIASAALLVHQHQNTLRKAA